MQAEGVNLNEVANLIRELSPIIGAIIAGYVAVKLRGIHTLVNSTATEQRQTIAEKTARVEVLTGIISQMTSAAVAAASNEQQRSAIREAVATAQRGGGLPLPVADGSIEHPIAVKTIPGEPLLVVPVDKKKV